MEALELLIEPEALKFAIETQQNELKDKEGIISKLR